MCKIRVIHILQSEWFLIKFAAQSWRDFHLAVIYKLRVIPLGRQRGNHRLSKIPLIHQMADARLTACRRERQTWRQRIAVIREFCFQNKILNERTESKDVCFLALFRDVQDGIFGFA